MNITSDVLINQLIPLLKSSDIKKLCLVNPNMRKLCQNERLWENLSRQHFNSNVKPNTISWFEFYVQSYKSRDLILKKYPDSPTKPDKLSYFEYYNLLDISRIIELTKQKTMRIKVNVGNVYIIPDITTIRMLLKQIEEKAEIVGNYYVFFGISEKDDNRTGLIITEMLKYDDKYYITSFTNLFENIYNPSLKILVGERDYINEEAYEMNDEFKDLIILN